MGAFVSLCARLPVANALVIWARGGTVLEIRHRRAVFLLGGMGILAFVLSVISTYDNNNFHHRHIAVRRLLRVSGRGLARVAADGIPSHVAVPRPVAEPHLPRPEGIAEPLSIATISLPGILPSAACANRAPPLPL
jgi:hypothetical protein